MARSKRKRQPTRGDMVRSLAVIIIPVVVITILFTRNLEDAPVEVVDYQPVLAQARAEAPFPVLAPTDLPKSWRPIRVSWLKLGQPGLNGTPSDRNRWQLGFLSPDDVFVVLAQGDGKPEPFIEEKTREGLTDGTSNVRANQWQRFVSPDERTRSLVQQEPSATTIVTGDTSYAALEAYAATLEAN